jgi:hypothetical protein
MSLTGQERRLDRLSRGDPALNNFLTASVENYFPAAK